GASSGAPPAVATRSTLLTTSSTGAPASARRSAIQRSRPVGPSAPSTTNNTTSTSGMAARACCVMYSPSRCRGLCRPGVSTNTICASSRVSTAWMRWRVVCGLSDTMATLAPTKRLTRVDLPTLGRPMTATNPERKGCSLMGRLPVTPARQRKYARQKLPHRHGPPFPRQIGHDDGHVRRELGQHLAADAARRHRLRVVRDDGQRDPLPLARGDGRARGRPLRADGRAQGRVLEIAARKDASALRQERRPHLEPRVGHVRPFAHGAGFLQELFYVDVDLLLRTVICHVGDPPCPVAAGQCTRR